MKISENFSLEEVTKSQVALRLGINNDLPDEFLQNAISVAENILEPVRKHYGKPVATSSWYRSKALNKATGGSLTSDHCFGCAVDFEVIGVPNLEVAKFIRDNLNFKQLILEFYEPSKINSGWVHASYLVGSNKKEVLRTSDGKKYFVGLE